MVSSFIYFSILLNSCQYLPFYKSECRWYSLHTRSIPGLHINHLQTSLQERVMYTRSTKLLRDGVAGFLFLYLLFINIIGGLRIVVFMWEIQTRLYLKRCVLHHNVVLP